MYKALVLLSLMLGSWTQPDQQPLHENVVHHPFSNPQKDDEFSIAIFGNTILEGKVVLTIVSHEGIQIYNKEFPSSYLIGYGLAHDADLEETEKYIKNRVDHFFTSSNFVVPAISPSDQFEEDYSIAGNWEEIKSNTSAIGFYYLIGEEAGCRIAYSKKEKKAIVYFCCC